VTGVIGRDDVLNRPRVMKRVIAERIPHVSVRIVRAEFELSTFELTFQPPLELVDYPAEVARITQLRDERHPTPYALPVGPARTWLHRYPLDIERGHYSQLCLWFPWDEPWRIWTWHTGFVDFVAITQRHLWCEEFHRREGYWPTEDAQHGETSTSSSARPTKEAA
jgi:hypothetical protein